MYLFIYFECCSNLDENTLNVVGICECGSINLAVYWYLVNKFGNMAIDYCACIYL
jgi:hypothetical protein